MRIRPAFVCIAAYSLVTSYAFAQAPSQAMLNGWMIGQTFDAVQAAFGKPYDETKTDDGWLYRTYLLREKPLSYMTFKFDVDNIKRCISVQIAGNKTTEMLPFAGLRLGASKVDVQRVFGKPFRTEMLDDPKVEVWDYDGRNYSFEFDPKEGLSSIQIMGYDGFGDPPGWPRPMEWTQLRAALQTTDANRLMELFAPDADIYGGDAVTSISASMQKTFGDPQSAFRRLLKQVEKYLQTSGDPVDVNMRLSPGPQARVVYKFAVGAPLTEIVLTPHAGKLRVWKIGLR